MWRRGNPLWTGPLCSMSLVLLCHILAVWLGLPAPQFVTLYNGEINCHSLSLLLRAVVRKLGTCFMKYCSNGFRFPKAVERKCFLVG